MTKRTQVTLDTDARCFFEHQVQTYREENGHGPNEQMPKGQIMSALIRQSREFKEWRDGK